MTVLCCLCAEVTVAPLRSDEIRFGDVVREGRSLSAARCPTTHVACVLAQETQSIMAPCCCLQSHALIIVPPLAPPSSGSCPTKLHVCLFKSLTVFNHWGASVLTDQAGCSEMMGASAAAGVVAKTSFFYEKSCFGFSVRKIYKSTDAETKLYTLTSAFTLTCYTRLLVRGISHRAAQTMLHCCWIFSLKHWVPTRMSIFRSVRAWCCVCVCVCVCC